MPEVGENPRGQDIPVPREECPQEQVREVSGDSMTQIRQAFLGNVTAGKLLTVDFSEPQTKNVRSRGGYRISSVKTSMFNEIIITRPRSKDRPNIDSESIRFKFNNPVMEDRVEIGYSRALRKGGPRSHTNDLIAIRMMGKFIRQMQADFVPHPKI